MLILSKCLTKCSRSHLRGSNPQNKARRPWSCPRLGGRNPGKAPRRYAKAKPQQVRFASTNLYPPLNQFFSSRPALQQLVYAPSLLPRASLSFPLARLPTLLLYFTLLYFTSWTSQQGSILFLGWPLHRWSPLVSGSSTGDDSSDISPACTKCEQWMPPSNSLADSKATRTSFQSSPVTYLLPFLLAKPSGLGRKFLCYNRCEFRNRAEANYVDFVTRYHLTHLDRCRPTLPSHRPFLVGH